ncbi:hypothetical protein J1N35_042878 [Gossypium stocksii]|uniref:Uncharacterized protein n=1 Tax=Gossypium stocksii TaxID=47602 RepID=A0A9D3U6A1_9ROSI|nr:hypothetical protein J1N35_042878 [Gossypium stocksii]
MQNVIYFWKLQIISSIGVPLQGSVTVPDFTYPLLPSLGCLEASSVGLLFVEYRWGGKGQYGNAVDEWVQRFIATNIGVTDNLQLELWGVWEGLQPVNSLGITRLIMKQDVV